MSAYYNEHDPKAAAWLRELIAMGEIAAGDVDERSILEIKPHELKKYTQCHFFAGVGGWSIALRLAGWTDDVPVWSGSCPCQPFSSAGKQLAQADERHLWPAFFALIRECRPEFVFGEQVASAIGKGWLDGVSADLESEGYACGAGVLGAFSVGAPHRRSRLYWMAHAIGGGCGSWDSSEPGHEGGTALAQQRGELSGMAHAASGRGAQQLDEPREGSRRGAGPHDAAECAGLGGMADGERAGLEGHAGDGDDRHEPGRNDTREAGHASEGGVAGIVGEPEHLRLDAGIAGDGRGKEGARSEHGAVADRSGAAGGRMGNPASDDERRQRESREGERRIIPAGGSGSWSDFDILPCRDGKARRVESGTFPLVDGIPKGVVRGGDTGLPGAHRAAPSIEEVQATAEGRVMRLRGYGNAIVPELAAVFISVCMEEISQISADRGAARP